MRVRVLATPGHTFTHLSYALEAAGRPHAVFTGGSLLYGSTGRPDLLGGAHASDLAHAQYASAHRMAAELPADADVYPTHGFGSFCSATQSEGTASTIGRERRFNPVLTLDEERYVNGLLAGLDAYRAYYAHMGPANAAGPAGPDLSPPRRADAAGLQRRIKAGEWVVDLRARRAFAAGHLAGTLSFDLDGSFATYLGWLIPWGATAGRPAAAAGRGRLRPRVPGRDGIGRRLWGQPSHCADSATRAACRWNRAGRAGRRPAAGRAGDDYPAARDPVLIVRFGGVGRAAPDEHGSAAATCSPAGLSPTGRTWRHPPRRSAWNGSAWPGKNPWPSTPCGCLATWVCAAAGGRLHPERSVRRTRRLGRRPGGRRPRTYPRVLLTGAEQRLLGIPPSTGALLITRLGWAAGRPVEWRRTLIQGDRFSLLAGFSARPGYPGQPLPRS